MRNYIRTFKALSDPNRIRILKMLEIRQLCVCEITDLLGLSASTVSQHCSILRDAGFILDKKNGKWVDYWLNPSPDDELVKKLLQLLPTWLTDDEVVLSYEEKVAKADRKIICCNILFKKG